MDLLEQLNFLNKTFQKAWVDPTQIRRLIDGTISTIKEYFVKPAAPQAEDLPGHTPGAARAFWSEFLEFLHLRKAGYDGPFVHDGCEIRFGAPEVTVVDGVEVTVSEGGPIADAIFCLNFVHLYCAAVIQSLRDRFPDRKLFEAFAIFPPWHYPSSRGDLAEWGRVFLEILKEQYGTEKVVDGQVFEPIVVWEEAEKEWPRFKSVIHGFRSMSTGLTAP